jgi:hypothetical protein
MRAPCSESNLRAESTSLTLMPSVSAAGGYHEAALSPAAFIPAATRPCITKLAAATGAYASALVWYLGQQQTRHAVMPAIRSLHSPGSLRR